MMIMRPPQHGHGHGSMRGSSVELAADGLDSFAGDGAASNARARAMLAAPTLALPELAEGDYRTVHELATLLASANDAAAGNITWRARGFSGLHGSGGSRNCISFITCISGRTAPATA